MQSQISKLRRNKFGGFNNGGQNFGRTIIKLGIFMQNIRILDTINISPKVNSIQIISNAKYQAQTADIAQYNIDLHYLQFTCIKLHTIEIVTSLYV